ncbi:MAG: hypothetical protein AB7K24_12735 [Gemmataceae bacterium]
MLRIKVLVAVATVLIVKAAPAAEGLQWVNKPALTFDEKTQKWFVTFELDAFGDVEVAIVDPKTGSVVRHLAAGVLGPKAPPPFSANSRAQKLEWDGKDDYRNKLRRTDLAVRVRAGMSVALKQIVGGDPYAYYSEDSGHHDHGPFGICGLEVKADGKVYVLGHSSTLGPPALRQYDVDGNYLQTLYPMPAGKNLKSMTAWGLNVKPDGTYTPKFNRVADPSLTTTFLDNVGVISGMARLFPTPDKDRLTFWKSGLENGAQVNGFELLTMNTDGTISNNPAERLPGLMVKAPPLGLGPITKGNHVFNSLLGPMFSCYAPDGKSFYLSGLYAATTLYGSIKEIKREGFWRDGQVWKVDLETRTARPFFALDAKTILPKGKERLAAFGGTDSYSALHGVAVDQDGNVFVCDRLNKRIVVLDANAKIIRQIPVEHPDAIAVSTRTGVLYVTTRNGDPHEGGVVRFLKFNDWKKDSKPVSNIEVSKTKYIGHHRCSYVALWEAEKHTNVWVAYTEMPVRIYRDGVQGLKLVKDFYRVEGAQRCLGFDRMQVDQKTDEAYVMDDRWTVWKIGGWDKPRIEKVPLKTASIAIDAQRRHIYMRTQYEGSSSVSTGKVARFHLDKDYSPANFGQTGTNRLSPVFWYNWCFEGNGDLGLAVAPNGNVAVVGNVKDGLQVFAGTEAKVPWESTTVAKLPALSGGVRFDLAGNLYVGYVDKRPPVKLPGFESDKYLAGLGRIHKYAPTGTLESGNLFPKAPAGPTKSYDVLLGAYEQDCVLRSPRFGVDGYGRIYYPTNIAQRVTVIDNAGNEILHFGTYGNRDSMGGLPGDLVPTKGIPLGFPNSVDATDNHIYVADLVNIRLLRLKKRFQAEATSR